MILGSTQFQGKSCLKDGVILTLSILTNMGDNNTEKELEKQFKLRDHLNHTLHTEIESNSPTNHSYLNNTFIYLKSNL